MIDWHLFLKVLTILLGLANIAVTIICIYRNEGGKALCALLVGITLISIGVAIQ